MRCISPGAGGAAERAMAGTYVRVRVRVRALPLAEVVCVMSWLLCAGWERSSWSRSPPRA